MKREEILAGIPSLYFSIQLMLGIILYTLQCALLISAILPAIRTFVSAIVLLYRKALH